MADWKPHLYRVGPTYKDFDEPPESAEGHRQKIEPWLSAVFQSEHLSLLLGNGFTTAISLISGVTAPSMETIVFGCELEKEVNSYAERTAKASGRGTPNIEDQIRAAISLINGLEILSDSRAANWINALDAVLHNFLKSILKTECGIRDAIEGHSDSGNNAYKLLVSFLLSFASRTATRERLHVFTTNYDRLIEYGCDHAGLRVIDRFVGALSPIFRSSRVDVDLHYNPPGIRGEPRYLEGVIKFTKLHGSIDWTFETAKLRRYGIPFGTSIKHPDVPKKPFNTVMIYPNPAKDVETSDYPYSELFRDFSAALCRPNSVLVTYGYGFGDDHINRVISDMLTIPSTHLVIISYNDTAERISTFCKNVGREAQISLLIGDHFGDLQTLVENYLPKSAIDKITDREVALLERRGKIQGKEKSNDLDREPS